MSSREIAELTKKEHSKVVADIERILKEVGIDAAGFRVIYTDSMNREQLSYSLPKRECDLVISGYVAKYRLAIIDRWQELESQQVPKTLSSALRLAADQAEQIELLQLQAQKDAPKVEFAMAVRNMQGACKLGDFGKVIGVGRNTLFQWLRRDEYLMGDNMPYQKHIDSGLFVVIEQTPYVDRDGKAHPTFTTILTGKGQVVIEKKYRKD
jgi:phage antirepressor YoqD-like protein